MRQRTFLKTIAFNTIAAAALLTGDGGTLLAQSAAQGAVEVPFYYPVAVGGPIAKVIDGFAADFMKANPGITVKPIYAGTYQETIVKALTAHKSGTPPVTSVLLSTDMFTLIDEDAVVPFDQLVKSAADKAWLNSFYPAFMMNSRTGGKTWGVPFQRSTVVMYWNKEAFKEAGLDPNHAPADWAEPDLRVICVEMRIASGTPAYAQREEALFMVFNGGAAPLEVTLPVAPSGWLWRRHIDTDRPARAPGIVTGGSVAVAAQSVQMLELERAND